VWRLPWKPHRHAMRETRLLIFQHRQQYMRLRPAIEKPAGNPPKASWRITADYLAAGNLIPSLLRPFFIQSEIPGQRELTFSPLRHASLPFHPRDAQPHAQRRNSANKGPGATTTLWRYMYSRLARRPTSFAPFPSPTRPPSARRPVAPNLELSREWPAPFPTQLLTATSSRPRPRTAIT